MLLPCRSALGLVLPVHLWCLEENNSGAVQPWLKQPRALAQQALRALELDEDEDEVGQEQPGVLGGKEQRQ